MCKTMRMKTENENYLVSIFNAVDQNSVFKFIWGLFLLGPRGQVTQLALR